MQHLQIVTFVFIGVTFRQDNLQKQFMAGLATTAIHLANQFILFAAQFSDVMWVVKPHAFHYMFMRPVDQLRADIAVLQPQWTRPKQLDRSTIPGR